MWGSQVVADRMAEELESAVRLGAPVRRIAQDEGSVQVSADGGAELSARRVIVAVPPALCGRIPRPAAAGDPRPAHAAHAAGNRDQVRGALRRAVLASGGPERSGGERGRAGEGHVRQLAARRKPRGAARVPGGARGEDARAGLRRSAAPRSWAASRASSAPRAAEPARYIERSWADEEWSRGCYGGYFPPGGWTDYGPSLRPPIGRVHWAGSETATRWMGYMDGAVESGSGRRARWWPPSGAHRAPPARFARSVRAVAPGVNANSIEGAPMAENLDGKRIAILATTGVEQVELEQPGRRWRPRAARRSSSLPSPTRSLPTSTSRRGTRSRWTGPSDASASDYDGLILPGGVANPDFLRQDEDAVRFTREFLEAGKPVGVICHGPWTLIEADVVRGKTITSYPSLRTDLLNAGANWVDREVVVDNGLVSSRRPDDLPAFCDKIVEELAEGRHEELAAQTAGADQAADADQFMPGGAGSGGSGARAQPGEKRRPGPRTGSGRARAPRRRR